MHSNFFSFLKMQVFSLSHIVWLQLLCVVLYPMLFNKINVENDAVNTVTYALGLLMLSYLIIRNFAFNDARYNTKLLFSILPVKPKTIIGARGIIIYLFCLGATPLFVLSSHIIHRLKPETFAAVSIHILPYGMLLATIFLPIGFLIFYLFETQKADIIAALAMFLYMGLMFLIYKYLLHSLLWVIAFILSIFVNMFCYMVSQNLYKTKCT